MVSKFGMVIKSRNGVEKRRLILDATEPGVTVCAKKNQRIPSVVDVVLDSLALGQGGRRQGGGEALVLDFADAFWTLPLRGSERRFFVGKLRGTCYVRRRLALARAARRWPGAALQPSWRGWRRRCSRRAGPD